MLVSCRKNIRLVFSHDEQLKRWIDGEHCHVVTLGRGADDYECLPDFSCCLPDVVTPVEARRAFAMANDRDRSKFLMAFLGGAMSLATSKKVHVTGGTEPSQPS